MTAEYLVCLATFVAILAFGVEKGMVTGLVLAALSFTITYAQASKTAFMLCFGRLRYCFSVPFRSVSSAASSLSYLYSHSNELQCYTL